jgi:hypothetical protein
MAIRVWTVVRTAHISKENLLYIKLPTANMCIAANKIWEGMLGVGARPNLGSAACRSLQTSP